MFNNNSNEVIDKWSYVYIGYSRLLKTVTVYLNVNGKELANITKNNWLYANN
jgi:hypothetical protein